MMADSSPSELLAPDLRLFAAPAGEKTSESLLQAARSGALSLAGWPVSSACYVVDGLLGSGTFGVVMRAQRRSCWEPPHTVALKLIPRWSREASRELDVLLRLRANPHPSVLQARGQPCATV